jgi:hypothetical protein
VCTRDQSDKHRLQQRRRDELGTVNGKQSPAATSRATAAATECGTALEDGAMMKVDLQCARDDAALVAYTVVAVQSRTRVELVVSGGDGTRIG